MIKKRYGIYGYIEYEIVLNIGGRQVSACFRDGSITQYGVMPAVYETSNPVVMYALEQTKTFKGGRIKVLAVIKDEAPAKSPAKAEQPKEESTDAPGAETEEESQLKEVAADNVDDAVEYLRGLGYKSHSLRSKAAVLEAAGREGIRFVTSKGQAL